MKSPGYRLQDGIAGLSALSRLISSVPVFVVLLDPKDAVIPVCAVSREKDFSRVYYINRDFLVYSTLNTVSSYQRCTQLVQVIILFNYLFPSRF
jgi:hypothetical protein